MRTIDLRIVTATDADPAEVISDLLVMAAFDGVSVYAAVELVDGTPDMNTLQGELTTDWQPFARWDGNAFYDG